jgi:hypothetical protein
MNELLIRQLDGIYEHILNYGETDKVKEILSMFSPNRCGLHQ